MTTLLPLASRRSRWLFDWSAAACLAAPDRSLNAITGQAATLTRAGIKRSFDANGVLYTVGHSRPAFNWSLDPVSGLMVPSVLTEAVGTNLCLQSEDWSTTWAAVGTPTRVAAGDTGAGVSLDTIGDDAAGTLEGYSQTVTFTGNAVKAVSLFVKQGTSTSSAIRLRDTTAGADRLLGVVTWSGTVATVTMTTGTYLGVVNCYGGVYRLLFATTSVTAANTNSLQFYPATTSALAIANTGTILAGGVQAEDALTPSSYVKTTTGTAARAVDALSFSFNDLPRALTLYIRAVNYGTAQLNATNPYYALLGGPPSYLLVFEHSTSKPFASFTAGGSTTTVASAGTNPALGELVELAFTVSATGTTDISQSINGAAATGSTGGGAAHALPATWGSTTLLLNAADIGNGYLGYQAVRIAAGVQTIATMRQG